MPLPKTREEREPAYLVLFIGGFGDIFMGALERVYREFGSFFAGVPYASAYYHWDGCHWGLLGDRCHSIAHDLHDYLELWPGLPVVMIGHSYGGSAAMEVARVLHRLSGIDNRLIVLTIDPVSRRQVRSRADGVLFWGNAWLSEGGDWIDFVPLIGGRWGSVPADVDAAFSGYRLDSSGRRFSHRRPLPMIVESPAPGKPSLAELAAKVLAGELATRGLAAVRS